MLSLEPAFLERQRNMTSVTVLVRLNEPRPDGAIGIGTSFIEGMRNAHRRMWLGRRLTIKLDDISFSGEECSVLGKGPVAGGNPPEIGDSGGAAVCWMMRIM